MRNLLRFGCRGSCLAAQWLPGIISILNIITTIFFTSMMINENQSWSTWSQELFLFVIVTNVIIIISMIISISMMMIILPDPGARARAKRGSWRTSPARRPSPCPQLWKPLEGEAVIIIVIVIVVLIVIVIVIALNYETLWKVSLKMALDIIF